MDVGGLDAVAGSAGALVAHAVRAPGIAARLAVASYNVHQCVGVDGRRDPARVVEVLRELEASIVGLQEVGGLDQLDTMARALGLHAVAGPAPRVRGSHRRGGHRGNALLTRHPPRAVRWLDLSVLGREPRGALDVDVDHDGRPLRVIVTHLGLLPGDRRAQVRRLLAVLGEDRHRPTVLVGDINEWWPAAAPLRRLHARLGRRRSVRTFPSRRPLFALDRIWVQPLGALVSVAAHASPLARVASDHLPVRGTIEWLPGSPARDRGA